MSALIPQGGTAVLTAQFLQYASGPPQDVDGLTITIVRIADTTTVLGPTATGITHLATGLYEYSWATTPSTVLGDYVVLWNATVSAPPVAVQASEIITVGPVTAGPCGGWNIDVGCCSTWGDYDPGVQAAALDYASYILWASTGRRYGQCPVTVRPCGNSPVGSLLASGRIYWDEGTWYPYIFNGVWRNGWLGDGCVGCDPRSQAYLPGPVGAILNVTVNNVVIDPSAYRVDGENWLVRTDGEHWPWFQDMSVDTGTPTFFVTYTRGAAVPNVLLRAAGMLACEYAKACVGDATCRLPGRITQLVRQGVTVSMIDPTVLLNSGLTGIWEVDQIITADNPYGTKAPMRLYSPDVGHIRQTTWPA